MVSAFRGGQEENNVWWGFLSGLARAKKEDGEVSRTASLDEWGVFLTPFDLDLILSAGFSSQPLLFPAFPAGIAVSEGSAMRRVVTFPL